MVCDKLRRGQTIGDEEFLVRVLNRAFSATISAISIGPVPKISVSPAGEDPPAGVVHLLGSSEHWSSVKARLTLGTNPWLASDGQPGTHVSDRRQLKGQSNSMVQESHG